MKASSDSPLPGIYTDARPLWRSISQRVNTCRFVDFLSTTSRVYLTGAHRVSRLRRRAPKEYKSLPLPHTATIIFLYPTLAPSTFRNTKHQAPNLSQCLARVAVKLSLAARPPVTLANLNLVPPRRVSNSLLVVSTVF